MFGLGQYQRDKHDAIWLAIMAMVGALIMLMMGVKLAGATEPQPPRFLPGLVAEWQDGIDHFRQGNFIEARQRLEAVHYRVAPGMPVGAMHDRALALWNVLTAQARGQYEQAMNHWAGIDLPIAMRSWKHVAIAAMHLERAENDEASAELAMAQLLDPENPVVHYYLGILHIQRADEAFDWPDYVRVVEVRLVAHHPNVVPNTKGMYELAATQDLERSIEAAACFDPSVALIPEDWTTEPQLRPTVADLLTALGATNFERNAHHTLGYLFFERGALEVAEEHLDEAKDLGAEVPYLFNELGERYEAEGRHRDAARAYLKAVGNGPDRVGALMRFFQNAGDSIRRGW
jgi:tetratricopeptide (TPR) repeat protein